MASGTPPVVFVTGSCDLDTLRLANTARSSMESHRLAGYSRPPSRTEPPPVAPREAPYSQRELLTRVLGSGG